ADDVDGAPGRREAAHRERAVAVAPAQPGVRRDAPDAAVRLHAANLHVRAEWLGVDRRGARNLRDPERRHVAVADLGAVDHDQYAAPQEDELARVVGDR